MSSEGVSDRSALPTKRGRHTLYLFELSLEPSVNLFVMTGRVSSGDIVLSARDLMPLAWCRLRCALRSKGRLSSSSQAPYAFGSLSSYVIHARISRFLLFGAPFDLSAPGRVSGNTCMTSPL